VIPIIEREFDDFDNEAEKFLGGELDRERPVVLYCRGGTRSTMATDALADAGFDAAKLSEGIVGWDEEGLGLAPEGGYVAESGEAAAILQARNRGS
jgi:rhodanese-related sulfurtransferase